LPMMNSEEYISYATEAYQNADREIPISFQEPLLSQNLQRNTDWQEEGFSPAIKQNYWVGISGGNENATYSFSAGYLDEEGTLPSSNFKRYSVRSNSEFQIGEKFRVGENIELSRNIWTGIFDQSSWTIRQLLQQSP